MVDVLQISVLLVSICMIILAVISFRVGRQIGSIITRLDEHDENFESIDEGMQRLANEIQDKKPASHRTMFD